MKIPIGSTLKVAFVFSFPFDYLDNNISKCKNRRFTKAIEFTNDPKERDFAQILEEKLKNLDCDVNFKVECILNDTTATLLSFANTNIYNGWTGGVSSGTFSYNSLGVIPQDSYFTNPNFGLSDQMASQNLNFEMGGAPR